MENWDEEERRKEDRRQADVDHDTLTRIDTNLAVFMKQFDVHTKGDADQFQSINKDMADIKKYLWMFLGVIAFLMAVAKFIK